MKTTRLQTWLRQTHNSVKTSEVAETAQSKSAWSWIWTRVIADRFLGRQTLTRTNWRWHLRMFLRYFSFLRIWGGQAEQSDKYKFGEDENLGTQCWGLRRLDEAWLIPSGRLHGSEQKQPPVISWLQSPARECGHTAATTQLQLLTIKLPVKIRNNYKINSSTCTGHLQGWIT